MATPPPKWLQTWSIAAPTPPDLELDPAICPRGCVSHNPFHASNRGACGRCGAVEDQYCAPGCPVDGIGPGPDRIDE